MEKIDQRGVDHHRLLAMLCAGVLAHLAISISLVCDPTRGGGDTQDLEARWRREYPAAAAELEAAASSFLARGSHLHQAFIGAKVRTERLTVAVQGANQLFIRDQRTYEGPGGAPEAIESSVLCRTPEYAFVLRRPSPEAPYRLDEFAESFGDPLVFEGQFDLYARATTKYLGATLLDRLRSSSFVLKGVDSVADDRGALVRVEYECDRENSHEVGTVHLSPNLHWAIVDVDVDITTRPEPSSRLRATYRMDYDAASGVPAVPRRIEYVVKSMNAEGTQQDVVDYQEIEAAFPPGDMFRLSAYGLPDIPLRPSTPPTVFSLNNPVLWAALTLAGVCFLLLAVLRARDRRAIPR